MKKVLSSVFNSRKAIAYLFLIFLLLQGRSLSANEIWINEHYPVFEFHYTNADKANKTAYLQLIQAGISKVNTFFKSPYPRHFDVWIQPNRKVFDLAYQKNYYQPNFHSDCWLVATGDGYRISILSPKTWDSEPCKDRYSNYADRIKTQKLLTHELVHVYHGQCNPRTDLSNGSGMDWFAEGLAYYVSGQFDAAGRNDVRKALLAGKGPVGLDSLSNYADISLRYSMCGSMAAFIDKTYGRESLMRLMKFTQKKEVLAGLKLSEKELLTRWVNSVKTSR